MITGYNVPKKLTRTLYISLRTDNSLITDLQLVRGLLRSSEQKDQYTAASYSQVLDIFQGQESFDVDESDAIVLQVSAPNKI